MDGTYLYVTDSLHTIRKIELLTTTPLVSTPFGLAGVSGTTDAIGTNARFYQPQGIASDGSKLYIADTYNHTIRRIQ
jgi:hypothetical protein